MLVNQHVQGRESGESASVAESSPSIGNNEIDVKAFASRYWGGPARDFTAAYARLERLRPNIEGILTAEGVPRELAAVVLIESGAQSLALSPRGARGLWQFIPETARRYGLVVSASKDERIEPEPATRAAARYLRDLYDHFGNWPLALAAYNTGQNAVQAALEKGRTTTFWELSSAGLLPAETRRYVPAVVEAMGLLRRASAGHQNTDEAKNGSWIYASSRVARR